MKKLLDVGCGPGTIGTIGLYETLRKEYEIYGIDFIKSNIVSMKNRFPQGEFSYADAASLPFDNNYFDAVVARHIFEHLDNPNKVLKEIRRVSKPKALLTLTVPHERLESILLKTLPHDVEEERHHQRIFTEKSLLALLKREKFITTSLKLEKWPWFILTFLLSLSARFTNKVTIQEQTGVFQVKKKNYLRVKNLYPLYLAIYKVLMILNKLPLNFIIPFEIEITARNKKK